MRKLALVVSGLLISSAASAADVALPQLGRPASAEEIEREDISVPPDGSTLPQGHGSVAEGSAIFTNRCEVCHGERGTGTAPSIGGPLTGGVRSLRRRQAFAHGGELLALRDYGFRLHPPRHAAAPAAIADQ